MDPITVPVPSEPPTRADLRSHLHRRLQEAAKGAPHLPHGLLIHALWDGGYARDAFTSDTEFIVQAKRDVQRVKDRLLSKLPGVLCDTFHVSWRFGEAYRGLLKEYWRISAILPPSNGEWTREEASAQHGMEDDGRTAVHFHVREDLAEPQTLTLQAKTYMDVFIVGNVLRRLVAKGVDPANTSVFTKLPNGALLRVHWYDALPVPAPPFKRIIELELHCRTWRAPVVTRTHRSTGRTVLCAFYNKLSEDPRFFHLPVLEGGWIELALSRNFLVSNGVEDGEGAVILRGSTLNPSSQLEATWEDPIAVPPQCRTPGLPNTSAENNFQFLELSSPPRRDLLRTPISSPSYPPTSPNMGPKRANKSTSKQAGGTSRRAQARAANPAEDAQLEQAATLGDAPRMDVDPPEHNTRSRARGENRGPRGPTAGEGGGDVEEEGGVVERGGVAAVEEDAMEVDVAPAPIRRSARQAGVRAPDPFDAPAARGATSTKADPTLPAKTRAKGAGAMSVDASLLSTKVGPPAKAKSSSKKDKPTNSSAVPDALHGANARVSDGRLLNKPKGWNQPVPDGRGSPSVRGPSPRRSASVSRPLGEYQSSRLVLDYVEVPTSRRGPAHAQPSPSPSSSPIPDPPSSPPADTPPPSDDSDDDDPTDNFDPGNASGPEPEESDSNRSSGNEEGYATPTPRPRKRSHPSGDSPSTARPQTKRPRPAAKGSKGRGNTTPAASTFDADAENLFGSGGVRDRHPPSPAKKKKAKRKSRSPSTDPDVDLSPPPQPKRKRKSKAKAPSPHPGSSANEEDRPPHKNKGKGKAAAPDDADQRPRKNKGKGKAPPPPPPPQDDGDESDDDDGEGRPSRKDKGKGRALPEDDDDGEARHSRKDKGKGKAPPEDDEPSNIPGVFNTGDFLADDAELPSLDDLISFSPEPDPNEPGPSTRRDSRRRRQEPERDVPAYAPGRLPDEARSKAAEKGVNYILELQAIAQEYNKPLDVVFRLAGWMHSDSAHARRWQRANVFRRFWAATNPMDDSVSSEERRAQMDAAYREKMAELGSNPTASQLMDHFKKEYDYCVEMDQHLIDNLTSRQRQRQIDSLAQQFSRLALAANLNNGVAVVGYVVDLSGRANSGMFGGGPVYDELLRRYSGNFSRGLEDMSTMLRACDLRLRGLHEDGDSPAIALEDPVEGWFPVRDWSLDPDQNKSDEYLRILYELLRWDLGAIYLMANERLSSRHTAIEPRQFPRALWPDIAYRLGICLVNWPESLRRNMPAKDLKRKPSGRSWSSIVAGMVNYRRRGEAESNRRGLREEEALRFLLGLGVPALVPLPADYALLPHHLLANNPIVQSPRPPLSAEARIRRPNALLQWRDSERYLKDRREGTDSRIKWQSYWGPERNNGLVHDDDMSDNGDARASAEGLSPRNINHPSPDSMNNLWAPWTRPEAPSRLNRLSHASHLARANPLQMDEDEDDREMDEGWEYTDGEGSGAEQVSAAARADALRRLKRARESNPRISSKSKGSSKEAGPSKSSKGGKGDKSDKSSKGGSKRK